MTVKELIRHLEKMPQDTRVYIYCESNDCDITLDSLVYDGEEVCLWSDTGRIMHPIRNNEEGWNEE